MPSPDPSLVLGVFDGTHDAGAALVRGGRLIAACNEERFSRKKGQGGWPAASIAACLEVAGVQADQLDAVAFAGLVNPNPGLRLARGLQRRWRLDEGSFFRAEDSPGARLDAWLQFDSPFPRLRSDRPAVRAWAPLLRARLRAQLRPTLGRRADRLPIHLQDHHRCHAAAAWFSAGEAEGLVLVADGLGDGLALSVWRGRGAELSLLDAWPFPDSYGLLYATITGFLGFRPFRHEGKLTGLAAAGDPGAVTLPFPFEGPPQRRRFTQRFGAELRPWLERLRPHRREDISAWLQLHIEQDLRGLLSYWMEQTSLSRVALGGGLFANVRLNQRLAELPGLERLWVFPHMGDGGLGVGAAWLSAGEASGEELPHAFLGPIWEREAMRAALQATGLPVEEPADLPAELARRLARGQIVGRFEGAMEFGPRALGNRSILASAEAGMPERLNEALSRSDFMPFAPILLAEDADLWVEGLAPIRQSAAFMTVAARARPELKRLCPAIVHLDGSLRAQLVDRAQRPFLHATLTAYRERTGRPALINTSFNLHEEPIVCSPDQAVESFTRAGLNALAMGPYLCGRARTGG